MKLRLHPIPLTAALVALFALVAVGLRGPAQHPVTDGFFAGDGVDLSLQSAADTASGEIWCDGVHLSFTGRWGDGELKGVFSHVGGAHSFRLTPRGAGVALSSDGVTHELQRVPHPRNPLARASPAAVTTMESDVRWVNLGSGTALAIPSGWQTQWMEGVLQLVAPSVGPGPAAMFSVAEMPWNDTLGDAALQLLGQFAAGLAPGAPPIGAPRREGAGDQQQLTARYGLDHMGLPGAELRLTLRKLPNQVLLLSGMGPAGLVERGFEDLKSMLQTARPGAAAGATPPASNSGPLDPQLMGLWRRAETFGDWRHDATLVNEQTWQFFADGTYAMGSRAAGGGFGNTFEAGHRIHSRGTWSAAGGVLRTRDERGNQGEVRYTLHNGQLALKQSSGGYVFWTR